MNSQEHAIMLDALDYADTLASLVQDWADHDDMKRGCQGETCPWCYSFETRSRIENARTALLQAEARGPR